MTSGNITEHLMAAQQGTTEERKESESKDGDGEEYGMVSDDLLGL